MSCVEIVSLLPYRALDCLEPDERELLAKHLETCTACAAEARLHDEVLREMKAEDPDAPRPRADLFDAVWAECRAGASAEEPRAAAVETVSIALTCAFCHDVLARGEACYCASCLAPHHEDCFRAHGRCSAFGCEETRVVRPRRDDEAALPQPRTTRGRGLLLTLPLALLAGGAVAALGPRAGKFLAMTGPAGPAAPSVPAAPPEVTKPTPPVVAAVDTRQAMRIDVEASGTDLKQVVRQIGARVGLPILVDPAVEEKVSISLREIPWRDAIDLIARMTKCQVATLADGALVLEKRPRVTLQFTDTNCRTVLQILAAYSGKNILVAPEVKGTVTLDVREAAWDVAATAFAKALGPYRVERKGQLFMVRRSDAPRWGSEDLLGSDWPKPLAPGAPAPRRLDLDLEDVGLADALEQVGRAAQVNVFLPPDAESAKVSLHARDVSWRDAVSFLARHGHVSHRVLDRAEGVVVVEPLPQMTLQLSGANVRDVLSLVAARAGKNLVLSPGVQGQVTLDVREVPYDELLEGVATFAGNYEVVSEGSDLVRVSPRKLGARATASTFTFPSKRTVELAIEGVVLAPAGDTRQIVVAGRVYAAGDELRDANNDLLGVRVVSVRATEVELEDGRDPARSRLTVKVEK